MNAAVTLSLDKLPVPTAVTVLTTAEQRAAGMKDIGAILLKDLTEEDLFSLIKELATTILAQKYPNVSNVTLTANLG